MNTKPCVFVVDDDEAVCDGLEMVMETVGLTYRIFRSAELFLENYDQETPGCLVLDINMPGMNGDELQAELIRRNIRLPVIFLTAFGDIPTSVRTIKAGAVDFLTKPVEIKQLIERIQNVLEQENQLIEQNKGVRDLRKRIDSLTHREMEILVLVIEGRVNKEIAQQLGISFRTVELHRTNILRKVGAGNFLELVRQCEASHISIGQKNETS